MVSSLERVEHFQEKQIEIEEKQVDILNAIKASLGNIAELNQNLKEAKAKDHNDLIKYLVLATIMAAFGNKGLELIFKLLGNM